MKLPKIVCGLGIALLVVSGCGGGAVATQNVSTTQGGTSGATDASSSTSGSSTTSGSGSSSGSSSGSGSGSTSGTAVTGSASLTWNGPTENSDGTPLTNLAGYKIYYGTNATALSQTIDVPESASAAQTSYVVQSLSAGTWYFAVSAYTSTGTESSRSNVGSKTIN